MEIQTRIKFEGKMLVQPTPEVVLLATPEDVAQFAARRVIEQVSAKPSSVLTLPTGQTPVRMYELLIEAVNAGQLDLSQVILFNLDEYYPIRKDSPNSYARYMQDHLIEKAHIPLTHWHIPNGEAENVEQEAKQYDELLNQYSPVDLAVLGIGPGSTCHVGFNERGSSETSRTRYMTLDPETREVNAKLFNNPDEIPTGAITQGIANVLEAKDILLLATGPAKARGIQRTLYGPIGDDAPSTFLRYHPQTMIVVDAAAGALLPR